MAKTRIPGVLGHQGNVDPAGMDDAMKETLGVGKPAKTEHGNTVRWRPGSFVTSVVEGVRARLNSTGSTRSPSTIADRSKPMSDTERERLSRKYLDSK